MTDIDLRNLLSGPEAGPAGDAGHTGRPERVGFFASAEDPSYTVVPQRERREQRAAEAAARVAGRRDGPEGQRG